MTDRPGDPTLAADESDSLTTTILDLVADREGTDVGDLPPLYDAVNPDALETLFEPARKGRTRTGRLEFTYHGYVVTLVSDRDRSLTVTVGERNTAYRWFREATSTRADVEISLD